MKSDSSESSNASGLAPSGASAARLEAILDEYLQELGDGRQPDKEAYLARYPDMSEALRGVFKTLDFVEAASKTLHAGKLDAGQQLGDYRIVREIGRGGMGVVYEAIQTSLNRRVALKVLPTGGWLSANALERFTREAATAGRLHHTNIVPVHTVGEEDGVHYYVMQFIDGHSLSGHLKALRAEGAAHGPDDFKRVARWARQAAEALAYAHSEGIVHRDVKPSNLLVDEKDNVWVTDFGLAHADTQTTITFSGDVLGTARYMSPEQAIGGGQRVDERTDIYSLGATIYELLALEPAFDGDSRDVVLNRIVFSRPRRLRDINRVIPRELETIVGKCMEKDCDQRYARAADVAEDCRRFLAGESIRARRPSLFTRAARQVRQHRVFTLVSLLVVVLAITSVVLAVQARHRRGRQYLEQAMTAVVHDRAPRRAAGLLAQARRLGADKADAWLCEALIPLLNTQPQRAIEPLSQALAIRPNDVEACFALAWACYATGDEVEGRRYFGRANNAEIDTALAWLLRGHALGAIQAEGAIESYDRAIAIRSDFTPAIYARAHHRGNQLLVAGDRTQLGPMLEDFAALVILRPQSAHAYYGRAQGWYCAAAYGATQDDLRGRAGEWLENCKADLDRADALGNDGDIGALNRRGVYQRYVHDFAGSAATFARAMALDQSAAGNVHPGIVHHRAIALYALGDIQTALDEITPLCETIPAFFPLPIHRAILLAELGRLDEARAVCANILERQPASVMEQVTAILVMELLQAPEQARDAAHRLVNDGLLERLMSPAELRRMRGLSEFLVSGDCGDDLLATADDHPGTRCELTFFVALRALAKGDRDRAVAALDDCLDTGVVIFVEYRFAQAFAARMAADPRWPAWAPAAPQRPSSPPVSRSE